MLCYTSLAALFLAIFSTYILSFGLEPSIANCFLVICILSFFAAGRSKKNRLMLCYIGLVALFSAIFSIYILFFAPSILRLAREIFLVICILSFILAGILGIIRERTSRYYIEGNKYYYNNDDVEIDMYENKEIEMDVDEEDRRKFMCHRLSPPFLCVSPSIHMRVECFTEANSQ